MHYFPHAVNNDNQIILRKVQEDPPHFMALQS